jgi:IS5 family transposase
MIGLAIHQLNLFYDTFVEHICSYYHPILDPLDPILDDPELIEMVYERLASRHPNSSKTGRPGMSPDRLLRTCALKHLKDWSFRNLEVELNTNVVYRRFTHFYADEIPHFSTFSRNFALLGPEVTKQIHDRVVGISQEAGVTKGRKMRSDTTAVETNIHYPSDSSLLGDGIRVITRILKGIQNNVGAGAVSIVDHARAAKRRIIEITRAAKSNSKASQERLQESYRKLVALTGDVVRRAWSAIDKLKSGTITVVSNPLIVWAQQQELEHYVPLVQKVISQTKERVFNGNRHVAGKILSLFEPHSVPIRKGKPHKPTEFGRLIRIDEVEGGIIANYEVYEGNPADTNAWKPALDAHVNSFGHAPRMATADRGYFSAENERYAEDLGVERVVLPGRGRLSETRSERQKQRWFQRGARWRNGVEARIATLKHPFGLKRAMYKGDSGVQRNAGWAVIANNLSSIAKFLRRKSRDNQQQ